MKLQDDKQRYFSTAKHAGLSVDLTSSCKPPADFKTFNSTPDLSEAETRESALSLLTGCNKDICIGKV